MLTEQDILHSISVWNFEDNLVDGNYVDSIQAKIYAQLKTYFEDTYNNINDLNRVKKMLSILSQDFKCQSN